MHGAGDGHVLVCHRRAVQGFADVDDRLDIVHHAIDMQRQTARWDLPAGDFIHQHVLVPGRVHILVDKELAAGLLRIVAHQRR